MRHSSTVVIVGIGNDYRRDDGVGLHVARSVRDLTDEELKIVEGVADGYGLIETWSGSCAVFVIDCAVSGAEPGSIYRFDALNEDIPANMFDGLSTHSISLVQAIELARALDRLPESLIVYGVEGKDHSPGLGLSPDVETAARVTAERIVRELRKQMK
jgi:hydrogenase maturation protease